MVLGLANGTTYGFTVSAANAIGTGPSSDPSSGVTPFAATVPGPPTGLVAAAGDGMASVSWLPPVDDGGSPVTGYLVRDSDGDYLLVSSDFDYTAFGGLVNGRSYTFTVKALNYIGASAPSVASVAVVPQAGAQAATGTAAPNQGTVASTDPGGGPTPSAPLTTTVLVPATSGGGSVSITQTPATGNPPSGGYQFVGMQVDIVSTASTTPTNPLTLIFTIDGSAIAQTDGLPDPGTVDISRTEAGTTIILPSCTTTSPVAPDPCVLSRSYINGNSDLQVTVLTSAASHWTSVIKPFRATVLDTGYNPRLLTPSMGGISQWTFGGTRPHTVTDSLGLGPGRAPLFNSGALLSGRFGYVFRAAATYPYRSTVKGDSGITGSVGVPAVISPVPGAATKTYTVRWASTSINGYVFDVLYRFKKVGSNTWSDWKVLESGQSAPSADFAPARGVSTYSVVARLRNSSTGISAQWSPETILVVS